MKLGIVSTGNVGCAIALAAVTRGSAREIVLVNRTRRGGRDGFALRYAPRAEGGGTGRRL